MACRTMLPFPDASAAFGHDVPELGALFHRLNNQLGIILANAELLESKLAEQSSRARAGQIVASAVDAISTARDIRASTQTSPDRPPAPQ